MAAIGEGGPWRGCERASSNVSSQRAGKWEQTEAGISYIGYLDPLTWPPARLRCRCTALAVCPSNHKGRPRVCAR